ncbi:MAG: hypothetical protein UT29_C0001G0054 [Candidatus Yanofskybacteria bacterium GW2011_GWA1_39_13]|uniref:Nudix hydrolase domain-containing protein n=1 Tax=Yanofskybacteria sp. (strain GW2011_GWA1_39_13) TaxID=1619019 RepID=A0A0G0MES7_YANXG|nr:MAG: hypothetical protein UT29_C0001G0054 [Candidatus Yanofskybacteria bacterium GW2011_GWA1_39_13]
MCHGAFPPLTSEDSILLVHNISDADIARSKGRRVEPNKEGKERGKPAGFGLPGGGMKEEDFESPEEAARNELMGETGIRTLLTKPFLLELKGFKVDRDGEVIGRPFYFEKGAKPSVELQRGETVIENPIYLFRTSVDWTGSKLQQVFVEAKRNLSSGYTEEDLARDGVTVWLDDIDQIIEKLGADPNVNVNDMIERKGIVNVNERTLSRARAALFLGIEEFDEIDGLLIIPLRTLLGEIYNEEKRKPQDQRLFYTSHLRRLRKGFEEKGSLDAIMSAI